MAVVAATSDGLNIAVIARPATALRSELTAGNHTTFAAVGSAGWLAVHANEHPPGTRYEREVAGGAEDYYAMRGEVAGEWTRSGAQALGLEGATS